MFTKSSISQSMIDAVNKVLGEKKEETSIEPQQLDEGAPVKIPTPTGTRVLGNKYGNSAKAYKDQTKSAVDTLKGPKKKELEEDKDFANKLVERAKCSMKKEEIDPNVRTKDTLAGRVPTGQKDDVGPEGDGKSTKVKFRGGPLMTKEDVTDEEVEQALNEVLSKDATAGDWIHDFVHSDNPKFAGKSKAERKKMALGAYYAKQNEWKEEKEVEEELKGSQHKIDVNKNKKIDAMDFKLLRAGKKPVEESMQKSDVPAYLRKQKGEKPLTVADVKGPRPDSISSKEALTKARNEEVEDLDEGAFKRIATDREEDERLKSQSWKKETPWMKSKDVVTDKSGAKHTPMSRARDLARSAMKKIKQETMMGKAGTTSESKK